MGDQMSIEKIAAKYLDVESLTPVNSDGTDFKSVHVRNLADALTAAYEMGVDEMGRERDDAQAEAEELRGEIDALRKRLGEEDELLALRELFYCVKDHLRGCGDPHKFKRAFDRVQIELDEPMMHVA